MWMRLIREGRSFQDIAGVRRYSDMDSHGPDKALDYQRAEGATLIRRCHPSRSTVQPGTFTFVAGG
jgi:hypothetical protein